MQSEGAPRRLSAHAPPAPVGRSLVGVFEQQARQYAEHTLYSWLRNDASDEASLTYRELRERALSLCAALRRAWSVGEGERAMLIYPPGLELLVAFFGCNYAAVIAVPYYPPVLPASAMPSVGARNLMADGLDKVRRGEYAGHAVGIV
eukprot:scaffold94705_cov32-Tisochrysis_lutea.AAC.1